MSKKLEAAARAGRQTPELAYVRTVFGDIVRVARTDLDSNRKYLPMYTTSGIRFSDWHERLKWDTRGLATAIRRENIEGEVQP